jgi:hypothetical protein
MVPDPRHSFCCKDETPIGGPVRERTRSLLHAANTASRVHEKRSDAIMAAYQG